MESMDFKWDESVKIEVADSKLSAFITLNMDEEHQDKLNEEILKKLLEEKGIVFGIDFELIKNLSEFPKDYLDQKITIATGIEPKKGNDAYLKWQIDNTEDHKGPKQLKDGRVDFYSMNQVTNIRKGQILAEKVYPTEGVPGKGVDGNEIPAKKGTDLNIKQGKNVLLNESKDKIYSAIDGQLMITDNNKINVFPIYEVNGDVDFSIGNIDFIGTVIIRGNVPDGFKIKASGDIKVYGNVEGAELTANGNIFISQGLVGHNKSKIEAQENFQASFILNGHVFAGKDILISKSIMHSEVSAGEKIICKGANGRIVGGRVQAGKQVIATVIGNDLATATVVEVGINPLLRNELNTNKKKLVELNQSLDKVEKGINLLDKTQKSGVNLSPEKRKMQIDLLNQRLIIEKEIKHLTLRKKEIEEQLNNQDNTNIQALKVVHAGVKLVMGKVVKFIKHEAKYIKFVLEDGEVVTKSL